MVQAVQAAAPARAETAATTEEEKGPESAAGADAGPRSPMQALERSMGEATTPALGAGWPWPWGTAPWFDLGAMERLMTQMMGPAALRGWMNPAEWPNAMLSGWSAGLPRLDVVDRDEEVLVRAEVPGAAKDDVDVTVGDGTLTIRCASREQTTHEAGEFHRRETRRHAFRRTVPLPAPVDDERAEARLVDGVLEVRLPKSGEARRRQVPVA